MLGFFKYCGMAVSFVAMLTLAEPPDAFAQKKLTYEQAWAACIKEVKSSTYPNESSETNQRYTRAISLHESVRVPNLITGLGAGEEQMMSPATAWT